MIKENEIVAALHNEAFQEEKENVEKLNNIYCDNLSRLFSGNIPMKYAAILLLIDKLAQENGMNREELSLLFHAAIVNEVLFYGE